MQTNIKYSEIKKLKAFCEGLTSQPDWRDVFNAITCREHDFEVSNVRFIDTDNIDEIQQEELGGDEYILGCFNADFLSEVLNLSVEVIEAIQDAEGFEALGKMVLEMDKLEELQEQYASADGYGHHFNHYDGNEEELFFAGNIYHVFDNR